MTGYMDDDGASIAHLDRKAVKESYKPIRVTEKREFNKFSEWLRVMRDNKHHTGSKKDE